MRDVTSGNFGLLIAFVLPGFTAVWGASYLSPVLRTWLGSAGTTGPTVGGFLYVTLASVAAGLIVSTVRWAVIDTLHHATGIPPPSWDYSKLQQNAAAYTLLNENHYKFYQFSGNTLISLLFVWIARRIHFGFFTAPLDRVDVGLWLVTAILFVGSRDTLRKFYVRVNYLLGSQPAERAEDVGTPQADMPAAKP